MASSERLACMLNSTGSLPDTAVQPEPLEASAKLTELVRASSWIQKPQHVHIKGKGRHVQLTGCLLGGHVSSLESLLVRCSCQECNGRGIFSILEWFEHAGLDSQNERVANLSAVQTSTPKATLGEWLRDAALHFGGHRLIGQQVYVYWYGTPRVKRHQHDEQKYGVWYEAVVRGFNPETGEHRIKYKETSSQARRNWERESYDVFLPVAHAHFGEEKPRASYRPAMVRPMGVPPLPDCPLPPSSRRNRHRTTTTTSNSSKPQPPVESAAAIAPQQVRAHAPCRRALEHSSQDGRDQTGRAPALPAAPLGAREANQLCAAPAPTAEPAQHATGGFVGPGPQPHAQPNIGAAPHVGQGQHTQPLPLEPARTSGSTAWCHKASPVAGAGAASLLRTRPPSTRMRKPSRVMLRLMGVGDEPLAGAGAAGAGGAACSPEGQQQLLQLKQRQHQEQGPAKRRQPSQQGRQVAAKRRRSAHEGLKQLQSPLPQLPLPPPPPQQQQQPGLQAKVASLGRGQQQRRTSRRKRPSQARRRQPRAKRIQQQQQQQQQEAMPRQSEQPQPHPHPQQQPQQQAVPQLPVPPHQQQLQPYQQHHPDAAAVLLAMVSALLQLQPSEKHHQPVHYPHPLAFLCPSTGSQPMGSICQSGPCCPPPPAQGQAPAMLAPGQPYLHQASYAGSSPAMLAPAQLDTYSQPAAPLAMHIAPRPPFPRALPAQAMTPMGGAEACLQAGARAQAEHAAKAGHAAALEAAVAVEVARQACPNEQWSRPADAACRVHLLQSEQPAGGLCSGPHSAMPPQHTCTLPARGAHRQQQLLALTPSQHAHHQQQPHAPPWPTHPQPHPGSAPTPLLPQQLSPQPLTMSPLPTREDAQQSLLTIPHHLQQQLGELLNQGLRGFPATGQFDVPSQPGLTPVFGPPATKQTQAYLLQQQQQQQQHPNRLQTSLARQQQPEGMPKQQACRECLSCNTGEHLQQQQQQQQQDEHDQEERRVMLDTLSDIPLTCEAEGSLWEPLAGSLSMFDV